VVTPPEWVDLTAALAALGILAALLSMAFRLQKPPPPPDDDPKPEEKT
jgi:hypothetical protein